MWLHSLVALWRSNGRPVSPSCRKAASARLTVEALGDRNLPSTAHPVAPLELGDVAAAVAQAAETFHVADGSFNVHYVHGSELDATAQGNLILGSQPAQSFTIDADVKVMGNHIAGEPTMVFGNGSTLTFSYQIKVNRDTGIFEGSWTVTGGTGQFAGASGGGTISYPVAATGPLFMDGTISR